MSHDLAGEGGPERRPAGPVFEEALNRDLSAWPVVQARIKLAYGEWLRRRRRD